MKLMSLGIAPEINLFMTKLYDSMLASGSRIVGVHDTSITEAALIRAWVYIDGGVAACIQIWEKGLLHKSVTFRLGSVLTP